MKLKDLYEFINRCDNPRIVLQTPSGSFCLTNQVYIYNGVWYNKVTPVLKEDAGLSGREFIGLLELECLSEEWKPDIYHSRMSQVLELGFAVTTGDPCDIDELSWEEIIEETIGIAAEPAACKGGKITLFSCDKIRVFKED